MSSLWTAVPNIEETPPVRQGGQKGSRVLVQSIVVAVAYKPSSNSYKEYGKPVLKHQVYYLLCDSVHSGE